MGDGHAAAVAVAGGHGVAASARPARARPGARAAHEVSHGPAEPHDAGPAHDDHAGGGHGHGPWHGPHESPTAMTFPLMALAVGAVVAGFFGIPAALGGGNAIEHFLEPSFTAPRRCARSAPRRPRRRRCGRAAPRRERHAARSACVTRPRARADGVLGADRGRRHRARLAGSTSTSPEIPSGWPSGSPARTGLLSNKYYVDELYDATVIAGTMRRAAGCGPSIATVVDGAVNGTGWLTVIGSWFSALTDRTIVDGAVNLVGLGRSRKSSYWFRRLQTGLVQNYALLMLFGIFAFVSIYLFVR